MPGARVDPGADADDPPGKGNGFGTAPVDAHAPVNSGTSNRVTRAMTARGIVDVSVLGELEITLLSGMFQDVYSVSVLTPRQASGKIHTRA